MVVYTINQWDMSILQSLQAHLRCGILDFVCAALSYMFEAGIFWFVLAAILLCFRKTRVAGVMLVASMALGFLVGELGMKHIFCRLRPCHIDTSVVLAVPIPPSYSFPSGHTCSSFASAVALLCFDKRFGIPALILAFVVGFSRLYLFVHFPTDVIAGAVLGVLSALVVYYIFRKYSLNEKINSIGLKKDKN